MKFTFFINQQVKFCCAGFVFFFLFACQDKLNTNTPVNLTNETICSVDGMTLLDYAGPKAQILWKNGKRTFYCEAREAFSVWLDPIQKQRIASFFLQDLGGVPWAAYADRWHNAENMFLVIDSKKFGSMGLSYVSFSNLQDAQKFQSDNGGELMPLNKITSAVLANSENLMRDHPGNYSPKI